MTSKNSFSKSGLLRDGMRRNLWAIVLSGLGFFLSLLLPTLMVMQRSLEERRQLLSHLGNADLDWQWENALNSVARMIGGQNPFLKITFIALAVVCGVALFAYLHSRQKVDFYHSLPISRTQLYANNFSVGLLCTLPMYFIMLGLTLVCVYAMGFGEAVSWAAVGGAVVCNLIIFLALYALTVLTTVVCGNTVIALLLLLWVMVSPMLAVLMGSALCEKFFLTFYYSDQLVLQAFRLSPLVQYFELDGLQHTNFTGLNGQSLGDSALGLLGIYLLVAVAAAALGCWLFRIRKSERAGTALAFEPVRLPIKVYICLFMGVAFGLVFHMLSGDFWFWPGLLLGVVIFHWVVEIIYAFDFHAIFKHPVQLAVIAAVLVVGMLCFKFDVTGYDRWVPTVDSLAAVDIMRDDSGEMLETSENIAAVQRLTEIGAASIGEDAEMAETVQYQTFAYRMKSGRIAWRQYSMPMTEEARALRRQITTSEEYKTKKWDLFRYPQMEEMPAQKPCIDVYTNAGGYNSVCTINDEAQVKQIIETLREETLSRTENGAPVLRLELGGRKDRDNWRYYGSAYVTAEDAETLALIRQFTSITPEAITADMVRRIEISYTGMEQSQDVTVTDRADIAALLENALNRDAMELYYDDDPTNGACLLESYDNMTVWAESNDDVRYMLAYPEGQAPDAVVERYRPDGMMMESAEVISPESAAAVIGGADGPTAVLVAD